MTAGEGKIFSEKIEEDFKESGGLDFKKKSSSWGWTLKPFGLGGC